MKKSRTLLTSVFSLSTVLLCGCSSHYELSNVNRQRIVVDSRYDQKTDAQAMAFLAPYKHQVDSVMGPVVGEVGTDMVAERPESKLGNLLPDILMWASKSYGEQPDFAVYNMGGMRASLVRGKVTYGDVLDVAPFENKICFLTLTGEKVLELFQQIAARGGEGLSHGVELVISSDGKLLSAHLHGKEIVPEARYRLATIDYLAQGTDGMMAFKDHTDLHSPKDAKNNTRFIITDYFREKQTQGQVVDAQVEGRVRVEK
jgi:2',3'-cyclic-nucleotide 2'-phosphodiesterase (5'-nucleotidase family)